VFLKSRNCSMNCDMKVGDASGRPVEEAWNAETVVCVCVLLSRMQLMKLCFFNCLSWSFFCFFPSSMAAETVGSWYLTVCCRFFKLVFYGCNKIFIFLLIDWFDLIYLFIYIWNSLLNSWLANQLISILN
jgi:hypothetical protein